MEAEKKEGKRVEEKWRKGGGRRDRRGKGCGTKTP